jgi:hypothetical protein
MEDCFSPFMAGASCYKHQGFMEESEIRTVMVPGSRRVSDQIVKENPGVTLKPLKEVERDDRGRNFITLFRGLGLKLPIRRIIIGPSRHQTENMEKAKLLVGDTVPIHPSETPYIG